MAENSQNRKRTERRRRSTKPLAGGRTPARGTQFPSQILGENVKFLRLVRGLKQSELSNMVNEMSGFEGWSDVTVSAIERGARHTAVDELFALALALKVFVVALLDPGLRGNQSMGLDLGLPFPDPDDPLRARALLLNEENPWQYDRGEIPWEEHYRKWQDGAGLRAERRENDEAHRRAHEDEEGSA